jgi:hypothetical protein
VIEVLVATKFALRLSSDAGLLCINASATFIIPSPISIFGFFSAFLPALCRFTSFWTPDELVLLRLLIGDFEVDALVIGDLEVDARDIVGEEGPERELHAPSESILIE